MDSMDVFAWGVVVTLLLSVVNSILTVGLTLVSVIRLIRGR